jgi:hypothetical protein
MDKRGEFFKIIVFIFMSLLLIIFSKGIFEAVSLRLYSHQNNVSDNLRNLQFSALMDLFFASPFIGHGLGAYSDNLIRSIVSPYSYEQQLVSFLPKFGVLGNLVLFLYLFYFSIKLYIRQGAVILLYLFLFVSSAIFNPYLFSSNIMIVYLFVYYFYVSHNPSVKFKFLATK